MINQVSLELFHHELVTTLPNNPAGYSLQRKRLPWNSRSGCFYFRNHASVRIWSHAKTGV